MNATGSPNARRVYLVIAASMLMQACLGATYSWSVIVGFLRTVSEQSQRDLQTPFTLFYIAFPATTVFAGRILERLGPRRCALAGGLTFGSGWIIAGFGSTSFIFTVIGIGLCGGVGVGLAYLVPIATGMRWLPNRRGLVTGLAVAGFGGGAAMVSQAAQLLMGTWAMSPFKGMQILGVAFLILVVPAAMMMSYPPGEDKHAAHEPPPRGFVRRREFQLLYLAMFIGLAAGFTVNANLAQLSPVLAGGAQLGATAVALFAIANAIGRISWGAIADCTTSTTPVQANLMSQAILLAISPWLLKSSAGLLLIATLAGFNYGGVLVLYAASVGRIWGNRFVGRIYGALFSSNCPAAIAPLLAGHIFDKTNSFTYPLLTLAALLLLGTIAIRTGLPRTQE